MKAFEGFKSELASGNKFPILPAGPYVARIINVKIDGEEPDQSLILRLDIAEGEYADYYQKRFHADEARKSKFATKYKGDLRLRIPNKDNPNSRYPETDIRTFNDAICKIEKSNPGYHWDWNERGLIGKTVGLNVRAGTYNESAYTIPYRLEVADDVRNGLVETLEPMQPRGDAWEPQTQQGGFVKVETDELPF